MATTLLSLVDLGLSASTNDDVQQFLTAMQTTRANYFPNVSVRCLTASS
jgi:hypothetical protein